MNQDKQMKQRFNEGRDDYNKRLRAAAQAQASLQMAQLGHLAKIDAGQIPPRMSISDMIDQMKKTGVLPIQNAPEPKIEEVVSKEMFGLLLLE
jgi:hypothetical protein